MLASKIAYSVGLSFFFLIAFYKHSFYIWFIFKNFFFIENIWLVTTAI